MGSSGLRTLHWPGQIPFRIVSATTSTQLSSFASSPAGVRHTLQSENPPCHSQLAPTCPSQSPQNLLCVSHPVLASTSAPWRIQPSTLLDTMSHLCSWILHLSLPQAYPLKWPDFKTWRSCLPSLWTRNEWNRKRYRLSLPLQVLSPTTLRYSQNSTTLVQHAILSCLYHCSSLLADLPISA